MPRNIASIYVSIFGKSLQFCSLVYIWILQPIRYVRFSNIIFNINMITISDIYVRTTVYLLQVIYIRWCRGNIQFSMSANSDFKNISMDNYKQELLTQFMLSLCVFVTSSLNILYVEVISKINCHLSTSKAQL